MRKRHGKKLKGDEKKGCSQRRRHPGPWRCLTQGCFQGMRRENYYSVWLLHSGFPPQLFCLPERQNIRLYLGGRLCRGWVSVGVVRWESPAAWSQAWGRLQTATVWSGWDEGRRQSSRRRRGDGAGTNSIEPRVELGALQYFSET